MNIELKISDESKKALFVELADAVAEKVTSKVLYRIDDLSTEIEGLKIYEERRELSIFFLHLLQMEIEYIASADLADVVAEEITSTILQEIKKHTLTIKETRRTLSSLTLPLLQNQLGYSDRRCAPQDVTVDTDIVWHSDVHGEDYASKLQITENIGAIVIADGVTEGCDGGEVAARVACEAFLKFLAKNYWKYNPFELLRVACEEAGKRVREVAEGALNGGEEWKNFVSERNVRDYEDRIEARGDIPVFASTLIAAYYIGDVVTTLYLGDGYILPVHEGSLTIHPYLSGATSFHTLIISDEERGIRGEPHLSSFLLKKGELLVMGSDGANLGYTPRGGFPYIMFRAYLKDCLAEGTVKGCGEGWYEKLKERDAISDDFSMGVIRVC